MSFDMSDKVALVTGAASGIGRATALAFAENGAKVVVSDIDTTEGERTVDLIRQSGSEAIFVQADISSADDVISMVAASVSEFGRLDFAFNNAGIEGDQAKSADCTEENWDRVLSINLKGTWLCMKEEIPVMLSQGGGVIVNCSSVAGLVAFPGTPAYVSSKHAVVGLTKTAALEYVSDGIRINTVCPGVIQTPMVDRVTKGDAVAQAALEMMGPMGRTGLPEEVAAAVVWLCSDAASFVTGIAMPVDGGYVAP